MRQMAFVIFVLALAGCSSVKLPEMPTQAPTSSGIERYGSYCEQLGNAKGSPAWEKCVRKQEDTYK